MSAKNYLIRKQVKKMRRQIAPWVARMGDGNGVVVIPGHSALRYVRPEGAGIPIVVHRGGAPDIEDYRVWVGYDTVNRITRVLGEHVSSGEQGGGGGDLVGVLAHATTHYITGTDPAYLSTRQITELLLTVVTGLTVQIAGGYVIVAGETGYVITQSIDLTSHLPAGACWVIIRANGSGVLSVQDGANLASYADLTKDNIPTVEDGYAALWAVKLYAGQTSINQTVLAADYTDLRFAPMNSGGAVLLEDHDHSGDAGDGGQLDWDDVWSDAVHDHSANGEGGTLDWDNVWSDAVHDHSANGEGGTLDWDNVWSDAVHDHSADGEGGTFDAANLTSGAATDGYVLTSDGAGGAAWEDISLDDLSNVDTTGTDTGDIIYNSGSGWVDYPLGVGSKIAIVGDAVQIGNIANDDYIEINTATGNVVLVGDATGWDDLRIAGSQVRVGVTAPALGAFGPSGSLRTLRFESNHHDEIEFEIQMPHSWLEGSNIHPHVHWSPVSATAGNVVWELEYSWANIDGTFGAPGNMAADAQAAGGTAWVHKLARLKEGGNEYIDGTGKTLSSMLVCRLHRNAGAGSDTLAADVAFLEIDFHYQIDGFGSDSEYIKDETINYLTDNDGNYLTDDGSDFITDDNG